MLYSPVFVNHAGIAIQADQWPPHDGQYDDDDDKHLQSIVRALPTTIMMVRIFKTFAAAVAWS